VKNCLQRKSLRMRLTLWYGGVTALILIAFGLLLLVVVRQRLRTELDRQLRIDFDIIEYQLERDATGRVVWLPVGAHGNEGMTRMATWFEVWSQDHKLLLRHWPVDESKIGTGLPAPAGGELRFFSTEVEPDLHIRIMERPARIDRESVIVRVIRAETDMQHALAEIGGVLALGLPAAVALSAIGGYFIARRSLSPIRQIAARARRIGADSLSERLPVRNPHDELGELATIFNDTLERLDKSFAELRRFTGDASHELRTPLTALRAVGEVGMREAATVDSLREVIGSMLEETQRLTDVVQALLSLSRAESGAAPVAKETVNLGDLLREVRDSMVVVAGEKDQSVIVNCDDSVLAIAARSLLRQALFNLVQNAIRYSPAGSSIRLGCKQRGAEVAIEVADEGPGIAREHHEKIFERFYRIDKARSRQFGGAGLGLAIAKWSIERQGGRIELESELGHGALFRIIFPATTAAPLLKIS
jgi:heavy metal sensor kinase